VGATMAVRRPKKVRGFDPAQIGHLRECVAVRRLYRRAWKEEHVKPAGEETGVVEPAAS